ncbi:uncharacterized protein [Lepeophtheirus salmonis]|uniref:uncharacterized protein n=1 Tax=Lepeophtheirus salmonis TaxID=72036 RepID=UPI001AE40C12|nr:uncharacterized protein LOC121114591 [Lepeophtheirus salmonis]
MALIIMDIIGELYARNQSYFVKMILIYAGHNSVCSCLLTCRSWYNMIRHGIGDWEGLVKRIMYENNLFLSLESAIFRERKLSPQIKFFNMTDLRTGIIQNKKNPRSWTLSAGGAITYFLLHLNILYTGMKDGRIKMWSMKPSEKALGCLKSRKNFPVLALTARKNILINSNYDISLCVWDLRTKALLRVLNSQALLYSLKLSSTHLLALSWAPESQIKCICFGINSHYDLEIKDYSPEVPHNQPFSFLDDKYFIHEDNVISRYELSEFNYFERDVVIHGLTHRVSSLDVIGDLLVYVLDNGRIHFHDLNTSQEIYAFLVPELIGHHSVSLRISMDYTIIISVLGYEDFIFFCHMRDLENNSYTFRVEKHAFLAFNRLKVVYRETNSLTSLKVIELMPDYSVEDQ